MKLVRRGLVALPLAMAAGAALAQAQQTTWFAVRGADNSFVVDMPGEPVYKVIDTVSSGGTAFVYHSYSLEYRRLAFVAQTALYPAKGVMCAAEAQSPVGTDDRAHACKAASGPRLTGAKCRAPAAESVGPVPVAAMRQLVLPEGKAAVAGLSPRRPIRQDSEAERFFKSLRLGA
jgi:hypothetical protein